MTKLEGQLWITLYFLVSKREFRERYQLNSFRTAQLLRVRKYLNEILLDQLPMLSDIQRYMDELTISDSTSGGKALEGVFVIPERLSCRDCGKVSSRRGYFVGKYIFVVSAGRYPQGRSTATA